MVLSPTSCSSCGAANRAQSAFCHQCGKPLTGGGSPMTLRAPAAAIEVSTNTSTQRKSYSLGLNKQEISIGRAPSNDIVIDEMVVSGFHLLIRRDGGQLVLFILIRYSHNTKRRMASSIRGNTIKATSRLRTS